MSPANWRDFFYSILFICKLSDSNGLCGALTLFSQKINKMETTTKSIHVTEILKKKENENLFFKKIFATIIVMLALFSCIVANGQKFNGKYFNNLNDNGVIINGYDPVAFFTDNK